MCKWRRVGMKHKHCASNNGNIVQVRLSAKVRRLKILLKQYRMYPENKIYC